MRSMLLAFAALLCMSVAASAFPKIEIVGGTIHDWGLIKETKDPLRTKIYIKNIGDDTLRIIDVHPSCGCTTAPISKKAIAPRDSAMLDITMNINNQQGKFSKSIAITSNDPDSRETRLFLKAEVYKPIIVFPQFMSFTDLRIGRKTTAKSVLTNETAVPIKITKVEVTPPDLSVTLKEGSVIDPKKSIDVEASYTPTSAGRFNTKIIIKTDCKEAPEFSISGWGNIISDESQPASPVVNDKNNQPAVQVATPAGSNIKVTPAKTDKTGDATKAKKTKNKK